MQMPVAQPPPQRLVMADGRPDVKQLQQMWDMSTPMQKDQIRQMNPELAAILDSGNLEQAIEIEKIMAEDSFNEQALLAVAMSAHDNDMDEEAIL